jgi:hypothetical protein
MLKLRVGLPTYMITELIYQSLQICSDLKSKFGYPLERYHQNLNGLSPQACAFFPQDLPGANPTTFAFTTTTPAL